MYKVLLELTGSSQGCPWFPALMQGLRLPALHPILQTAPAAYSPRQARLRHIDNNIPGNA